MSVLESMMRQVKSDVVFSYSQNQVISNIYHSHRAYQLDARGKYYSKKFMNWKIAYIDWQDWLNMVKYNHIMAGWGWWNWHKSAESGR